MDIGVRLSELARVTGAPAPVVSVYLGTRWSDEHQRERVRVFLKTELRAARARGDDRIAADLDWIESQAAGLVDQARFPDAPGVALFACGALGLRDVVPVPAPVENAFVVADAPFLRPLVAIAESAPPVLVAFVDARSARLVPMGPEGPREAVTLESDVPGHHSRGGWAQLAQARYQRHIQVHRGRHFDAVAAALQDLVSEAAVRWIVLAGETRALAAFRQHLPAPLADRVAGTVAGARHEADRTLVDRAAELVAARTREADAAALEAVLTEAAKGGRAVAGVEETLDAVNRGAVHRLFVLSAFAQAGRACRACGALQSGAVGPCRMCRQETSAVDLGEVAMERVLSAGGQGQVVTDHGGLDRVGGLAASLRYPL
jgi:peptide subunit release factor 1 (eRF1)